MPAQATPLPKGWQRITTDCVTVGLRFPPHDLRGTIEATPNGHLVSCPADPATVPALSEWLRLVGALHVEVKGERPRQELVARFTTLPDSVDIVGRSASLREVAATADGRLEITCLPAQGALPGILATLDTRPLDRDAALTPRQEELLEHCVAAGYYAIPRETHLRQIAEQLGLSTPSLSLALRRAEAKVMAAYVGRKRPIGPDGQLFRQSAAPDLDPDRPTGKGGTALSEQAP